MSFIQFCNQFTTESCHQVRKYVMSFIQFCNQFTTPAVISVSPPSMSFIQFCNQFTTKCRRIDNFLKVVNSKTANKSTSAQSLSAHNFYNYD